MPSLPTQRIPRYLCLPFAFLVALVLALFFFRFPSLAKPALSDVVQTDSDDEGPLSIGTIQGEGRNSPYLNRTVTFRGIVTGYYEDRNASGIVFYTLFVQDAPGEEDGDPATSDGIAVFLGRQPPSVEVGDAVEVSGRVTEFYGLSEIEDDDLVVQVLSQDNPLPPPVALGGVPADPESLEALEGMRVSLDGARVVAPTYSGCGFFVVRPSVNTRPLRERVDDALDEIVPILHQSDVDCGDFPQVKVGDKVSGLAGPFIYHFDQFKIVQQVPAMLDVVSAPIEAPTGPPAANPKQFTVASFNVDNYFDTVSDTGQETEPVPTVAELASKQAKLVAAIGEHLGCPTLLGLQEVEKEPLLRDLAAQLEDACGFTYAVSHRESVDARGVDLALLSHPGRVAVDAVALRQGCSELDTGLIDSGGLCPSGQHPLFSRPPLQVDVRMDGTPYTLFVNHFKSKRGGELVTEPQRLAQAAHLDDLTSQMMASNPDARLIVLGDLNDYALSAVLLTLTEDGGLVNPLMRLPADQRYTYTFGGAAQLLDYLLFSPAAADDVVWVDVIHMNADYPFAWSRDPETAFRVSDHDVPMALMALPEEAADLPPSPPATQPARPSDTPVPESPATNPPPSPGATEPVQPVDTPVPESSESSLEVDMATAVPVLLVVAAIFFVIAVAFVFIRAQSRR